MCNFSLGLLLLTGYQTGNGLVNHKGDDAVDPGFDQIERYMTNKKYTEKKYAMMLWAACNGYAALPKTFTNVLYQDKTNYIDMDNLLEDIMHKMR